MHPLLTNEFLSKPFTLRIVKIHTFHKHSAEVNITGLNKLFIMQTCPCNLDPLTPHFYIVKLV